VAIPVADIFEIEGSFVNDKGMAQAFSPVLSRPAGVEPGWKTIRDLAGRLGKDLGFTDLQGLRQGLVDTVEAAQ
jgi:NADH dehydrogenase/NADH:ubiquinone oxidoreductase subunit G